MCVYFNLNKQHVVSTTQQTEARKTVVQQIVVRKPVPINKNLKANLTFFNNLGSSGHSQSSPTNCDAQRKEKGKSLMKQKRNKLERKLQCRV